MGFLLHRIWVKNEIPLRAIETGLIAPAKMFVQKIDTKGLACPILWLDEEALTKLKTSPLFYKYDPVPNDPDAPRKALLDRVAKELSENNTDAPPSWLHWLMLKVGTEIIYIPTLIWEEMCKVIETSLLSKKLKAMERGFREQCPGQLPDNVSLLDQLFAIVRFGQKNMPVIASDIIRLLALGFFDKTAYKIINGKIQIEQNVSTLNGGIYLDLEDVELNKLPNILSFPKDMHFGARHGIVYKVNREGRRRENDILFLRSATLASVDDIPNILYTIAINQNITPETYYFKLYDVSAPIQQGLKKNCENMVVRYLAPTDLARTNYEHALHNFHTLLIWDQNVQNQFLLLRSNNKQEKSIKAAQELNDFYEKYNLNGTIRKVIPGSLVNAFSFLWYATYKFRDPGIKVLQLTEEDISIKDSSLKTECGWDTPGASLIDRVNYLKQTITNKQSHGYYYAALIELAKIYKQYPSPLNNSYAVERYLTKIMRNIPSLSSEDNLKYNDYCIPKTVATHDIEEQGGSILPASKQLYQHYITARFVEKNLKKEARCRLQIDKILFMDINTSRFVQKIELIRRLVPTATIDQGKLESCLVTFPIIDEHGVATNRALIKQIIDLLSFDQLSKFILKTQSQIQEIAAKRIQFAYHHHNARHQQSVDLNLEPCNQKNGTAAQTRRCCTNI